MEDEKPRKRIEINEVLVLDGATVTGEVGEVTQTEKPIEHT
jgi:hypothetical protein